VTLDDDARRRDQVNIGCLGNLKRTAEQLTVYKYTIFSN